MASYAATKASWPLGSFDNMFLYVVSAADAASTPTWIHNIMTVHMLHCNNDDDDDDDDDDVSISIAQNKLSSAALIAVQTNMSLVFRQKSAEKRTQSEF